jgi:hypothetical protein
LRGQPKHLVAHHCLAFFATRVADQALTFWGLY